MDWFRMYHEFASDPKVQSMTEAMQRRLLMLLCLRCSNTLETLQHDELAFALRISEEELNATKILFIRKNFINDQWEILQWDKRQFVSDSSAPRVKRHREKKKEEAKKALVDAAKQPLKPTCNVTLTPQNRTDTEQIQNRTDTEQSRNPEGEQTRLADAKKIFEYWKKVMKSPGSAFDNKRKGLLAAALKNYSAADICKAIRGCSKTPHNMGKNDRNTKYNGLGLILRDAEHIDQFIALDAGTARAGGAESIEQTNARVMAELLDTAPAGDIIDMVPA